MKEVGWLIGSAQIEINLGKWMREEKNIDLMNLENKLT